MPAPGRSSGDVLKTMGNLARPILMTSFAFIFGGMLGVTVIGLFLTPVFYVVIRGIVLRRTNA